MGDNERLRKPPLAYDVELLRAMADETRQRILQLLSTPGAGEMLAFSVTDIAEQVGLTVSTASHHLQILRRAGLVEVARSGRERRYALNFPVLRTSVTQFHDLLRLIDDAMGRAQRLSSTG